jgi:hypothetical protein
MLPVFLGYPVMIALSDYYVEYFPIVGDTYVSGNNNNFEEKC